jgi:prevent-host-death family protein
MVMMTLSLAETKSHLSQVVTDVQQLQEQVAITRNGRPAAYLISPERLAQLEDTAFWLSYPNITDSLAASDQDIEAGRTYTTEQIRQWIDDGMPAEAA